MKVCWPEDVRVDCTYVCAMHGILRSMYGVHAICTVQAPRPCPTCCGSFRTEFRVSSCSGLQHRYRITSAAPRSGCTLRARRLACCIMLFVTWFVGSHGPAECKIYCSSLTVAQPMLGVAPGNQEQPSCIEFAV